MLGHLAGEGEVPALGGARAGMAGTAHLLPPLGAGINYGAAAWVTHCWKYVPISSRQIPLAAEHGTSSSATPARQLRQVVHSATPHFATLHLATLHLSTLHRATLHLPAIQLQFPFHCARLRLYKHLNNSSNPNPSTFYPAAGRGKFNIGVCVWGEN